ncbi:hypothetical protein MMC30_003135 [Trapelia coarctata]|nr:hypothetical protein [Trapelia coarctata]
MPSFFQRFKRRGAEASGTKEESREDLFGLKVLIAGIQPLLDIIAVHGLNGHREHSFTAENNVSWLRDEDMLHQAIPRACILTWGYDSRTHSTSPISTQHFDDHAEELVQQLCLEREMNQISKRPIIFVAHSLGGLLVKKALIYCQLSSHEKCKDIKLSTYGIMFMGTPHQGGEDTSLGSKVLTVASIYYNTNKNLLRHLERDSGQVASLLLEYQGMQGDFDTKFTYETLPTPRGPLKPAIVVPAIAADHVGMVKFSSPADKNFRTVAGHLRMMASQAPGNVFRKWRDKEAAARAVAQSFDSGFCINFDLTGVPTSGVFVGREKEMELIEGYLAPSTTPSRRKLSVIHGLGGVGRTQLAIEYSRRHKDSYTSIFWLDGKTEESLLQSILSIAPRLSREQIPDFEPTESKGMEETKRSVMTVLKWFALDRNNDWLLIYDNIDKTSYGAGDDDARSLASYNIQDYLPPGDNGAIVVTTRLERLVDLGVDTSIKLRILSLEEGLALLQKTSRKNLERSLEINGDDEQTEFAKYNPGQFTTGRCSGIFLAPSPSRAFAASIPSEFSYGVIPGTNMINANADAVALVKRLEGLPLRPSLCRLLY